jgi:hypothetical protein
MAKQASRLADFEIPRADVDEPNVSTLATPVVLPTVAPRPQAEVRQALTVRVPVSIHERLRTAAFATRLSQQELVEQALDQFLRGQGM